MPATVTKIDFTHELKQALGTETFYEDGERYDALSFEALTKEVLDDVRAPDFVALWGSE